MNKKNLAIIAFLVIAILFSSAAVFAQTIIPKAKAKWTFLVFMNDVNNLYPYGPLTIKQLKKVGTTGDVNFVILRGFFSKNRPSQKLLIKKDEVEVIETPGKVDMGDYKEMVKFVKWAHKNFPADHYLLDIWNHGAGWKKRGERTKGISYDDNTGNHITTAQLGESMRLIKSIIGHELDILAMDACLMQMAEVHHEINGSVKYVLAAEEIEPGTGWPYDMVAEAVTSRPEMTPADFAKAAVAAHLKFYLKIRDSETTISAVDNIRYHLVHAKIEALAAALLEKIGDTAIIEAIKKVATGVQIFDDGDNCDLAHFCKLVNENITDEKINNAAREVIETLVSSPAKIVIANANTGKIEENAAGMSIYFPRNPMDPEYKKIIAFGKTSWANFIEAYCAARGNFAPVAPAAPAEKPSASGIVGIPAPVEVSNKQNK
ncbi:MAG TPA: clostripain-related cysteine peptidase [Candidatus Wallbacteria bacterium]|nr:clostripain-related cysteine peptidase [Candidatus Wallbacteria bacterium]